MDQIYFSCLILTVILLAVLIKRKKLFSQPLLSIALFLSLIFTTLHLLTDFVRLPSIVTTIVGAITLLACYAGFIWYYSTVKNEEN